MKINCRASNKLRIELDSFIRTRYLNSQVKYNKTAMKELLYNITDSALNNFFKE